MPRRMRPPAEQTDRMLLYTTAVEQTHRMLAEYDVELKLRHAHISNPRGPYKATRELMGSICSVLDAYPVAMSTRQVFYQVVSLGKIGNNEKAYNKVQRLVVAMRRTGEIPYDRIVDRRRVKHQRPGWAGVEEILDASQEQYRRNIWADQETVVHVCCEKVALEGVFAAIVDPYGAALYCVGGFTSLSFAYEWAEEIRELEEVGKNVVVLYFGDHDPSGLSIERAVKEELAAHGATYEWKRCGLLWGDFERFTLVNVGIKQKDSRAPGYVRRYGEIAAELDALPPDELRWRVTTEIKKHVDKEALERTRINEVAERESLALVAGNWNAALAGAHAANGAAR